MASNPETNRAQLLGLAIPIAIGLAYLYFAWIELADAQASISWPMTSGTVVVSRVATDVHDGDTSYHAEVEYTYTVGTTAYSDVVTFA